MREFIRIEQNRDGWWWATFLGMPIQSGDNIEFAYESQAMSAAEKFRKELKEWLNE